VSTTLTSPIPGERLLPETRGRLKDLKKRKKHFTEDPSLGEKKKGPWSTGEIGEGRVARNTWGREVREK